jgi:hypothetical protein
MNFLKSIKANDIFLGILPLIVVTLIVYFVAKDQKFTPLEITLLQTIEILGTGFSAGYFATRLAEKHNQERAKLALRRIATIYRFFPNLITSVQRQQDFLNTVIEKTKMEQGYVNQAFNSIIDQIYQQINTVNDAVDDWKDLVPDPEKVLRKEKEEEGKL